MPGLLRALQHRNYRLFYGGQAVSLLGMWIQMVALHWLTYRLTDSAAAVGLVAIAQQGPGLVIGPFAGALADRHSKRRILVIAHVARILPSALLGVLTLLDLIGAWQVIALAFLMGVCRAFEIPTRQAFVPDLVDRELLPNAIALNSALFNGARLVGPAAGGLVIKAAGEGWCFLANAVALLPITAALLAMRLNPATTPARRTGSLLAEIGVGLRYVRGEPIIWALLGGLGLASLAGMPYSVLLPSFVRRVLEAGPDTFGYLNSAVGIGAIASALVLAARSRLAGLERWVIAAGVLFGVALAGFARTESVEAAIPALVVVGMGFMVQMAATNTLLQLTVPDALRGRVMSLHSALFLGAFPLGGLVAGALADRFGEARVIAAGGLVVAVSALLFGRILLRRSRELAAREAAAPAPPQELRVPSD